MGRRAFMTRWAHVCTSHGVGLPALSKSAAAEIFARQAERQLAKGRRRPVTTAVGRYVESRQAPLARALHRALRAYATSIRPRLLRLYAERLRKDASSATGDVISRILAELGNQEPGLTLSGELEGPMLAAFKRAAALGLTQVGIEAGEDMTAQMDEAARAYAEERGGELIKELAGTTQEALRALLADAVEEGLSTEDLADRLDDLGAFGEARAETIARTELAYAHVQGNVAGWRASGEVVGKRWVLGDLHDVDDECDEAADAGVVALDDDFPGGIDLPPAHPRCCLPGTVVAPAGRVSAHFARRFEGEVVDIRTASNHLAVTPNHPVLTRRGWVAAGALQIGDHVFQALDPAAAAAAIDPDHDHVPTRIEEIPRALWMAGGVATLAMPAASEAFHGDGMPEGKVDVVWAAGALALDIAGAVKKCVYELLGFAHAPRPRLSRKRASAALLEANLAAPSRGVRGARAGGAHVGGELGVVDRVRGAEGAHLKSSSGEELAQRRAVTPDALRELDRRLPGQVTGVNSGDVGVGKATLRGVGLALRTDCDASIAQDALDYLVRNGQFTREAADRLAGLVAAAQVTNLSRRQYEGPVHNLSTSFGWYFADGIITHNCVCDVLPVLSGGDEASDDEGDGA